MADKEEQLEAVRALAAHLARLREIVANYEDRGLTIPIPTQLAIEDIERQIAHMVREPARH